MGIKEYIAHIPCSNKVNNIRLTLDIYARNDLQQILEHANILPGRTYPARQIIATIKTSPIGVEPQLNCRSKDLVEIRKIVFNGVIFGIFGAFNPAKGVIVYTIIAKHKQIGEYLKTPCCHTYRPQSIEHV
ncbi:Ribonuclease T2-like [Vigna unguiculata]|uniref:Ribonuclease T2-like n=1 Tax=Vigna unguiculata TaxID=3917 RepID=A0A4D6KPK5_VIGUN|nr:Ribonuclease T2-like [Vigna unguiculata]